MSATGRSYTQNFLKFSILLFKLYFVEIDEKIIVTTLYNVCAVPWGVFSTVGDILSTMGGYLEYCGVFSTVRGNLEYRWGIS